MSEAGSWEQGLGTKGLRNGEHSGLGFLFFKTAHL